MMTRDWWTSVFMMLTLGSCAPRPPAPAGASPSAPPLQLFDTHVHAFREAPPDDKRSIDSYANLAPATNVQRAVLISAGYSIRDLGTAKLENDFVADQARKNTRFIPVCGVHPLEAWAKDELARCTIELKFRGLKLHAKEQELDFTRPEHVAAVELLLEYAETHGLIVVAHVDRDWFRFLRLVEAHPQLRVILAHGLLHEFRDLAYIGLRRELARRRGNVALPNLYLDISTLVPFYRTSPARAEVVWQLRQFGIDQVFFGSDFPLYTPEETLQALHDYGFTPDELRKICSENAARVWR